MSIIPGPGGSTAMELVNKISGFYMRQTNRCEALGIDVGSFEVSHVAIRARSWREYVELRDALEAVSSANLENVWNGRPISKLELKDPIQLPGGRNVPLIELIPPKHQKSHRMGLEHVGYVVGADVDQFAQHHADVLTGQQYQGPFCAPYYIRFDDDSHVKFYRRSLAEVCALEGRRLRGFVHADRHPSRPASEPSEDS